MASTMESAGSSARASDGYRWLQLAIGVVCMVMIANYQYGWTFFVPDIQKKFGWDRASIQIAFTLFGKDAQAKEKAAAETDGCTTFGVLPEATADGKTWLGQNWDWL